MPIMSSSLQRKGIAKILEQDNYIMLPIPVDILMGV